LEEFEKKFHGVRKNLEKHGVKVTVATREDSLETPDCIFPNNWLSLHSKALAMLYPMKHPSRRLEVRRDILEMLQQQGVGTVVMDWTNWIKYDEFLEGTGALVLDRINRVAYVCISERASEKVAQLWCEHAGYELVSFKASDQGKPLYHTNVMMCIGNTFVVLCSEAIPDEAERKMVCKKIQETNKDFIEISLAQMRNFCGNVLELDPGLLFMSERAHKAFTPEQKQRFSKKHGLKLIATEIDVIETILGGGVRCMICEIFN